MFIRKRTYSRSFTKNNFSEYIKNFLKYKINNNKKINILNDREIKLYSSPKLRIDSRYLNFQEYNQKKFILFSKESSIMIIDKHLEKKPINIQDLDKIYDEIEDCDDFYKTYSIKESINETFKEFDKDNPKNFTYYDIDNIEMKISEEYEKSNNENIEDDNDYYPIKNDINIEELISQTEKNSNNLINYEVKKDEKLPFTFYSYFNCIKKILPYELCLFLASLKVRETDLMTIKENIFIENIDFIKSLQKHMFLYKKLMNLNVIYQNYELEIILNNLKLIKIKSINQIMSRIKLYNPETITFVHFSKKINNKGLISALIFSETEHITTIGINIGDCKSNIYMDSFSYFLYFALIEVFSKEIGDNIKYNIISSNKIDFERLFKIKKNENILSVNNLIHLMIERLTKVSKRNILPNIALYNSKRYMNKYFSKFITQISSDLNAIFLL